MADLSIISNFWSCRKNCWYCIWKKHPLKTVIGPSNEAKLIKEMNSGYSKIKLSGGSDPASDTYVCNFALKYSPVPVDIHTADTTKSWGFYNQFSKCVFHIGPQDIWDKFEFIEQARRNITTKVRFNFVLTWDFTFLNLKPIVETLFVPHYEVGFRELITDTPMEKCSRDVLQEVSELEEKHSEVKYIPQDDYSYYYMPDDRVYSTYLIKEEKYAV